MRTKRLTNTDNNKRCLSIRAESSSVQKHVYRHRFPFQVNTNYDGSQLNTSSRHLLATREYRRQAIIRWKQKMGKPLHGIQTCVFFTKKDYRRIAIARWKNKKSRQQEKLRLVKTNVNRLSQCLDGLSTGSNGRRQRSVLQYIPVAADLLPAVTYCQYCNAIKFYSETSNFCCLDGRIVLSSNELPLVMQDLLMSMSEEAKIFRTYIRTYNNLFAFTSLGVRADSELNKRNQGVYTFRVQGQVYHFINNLLPRNDGPKNLQLYFHDTDNEIQNRLDACPRLSEHIIRLCIIYLESNPYARFFRNLRDIPNLEAYRIVLKTVAGQDQRVYNKPDVSQVAALWVEGEENGETGERDIEVRIHNSQSRTIEYYFACYDPLQYPLMFPFGELGWHQRIPKKTAMDIEGMANSTSTQVLSCDNFTTADQLLAKEKNVLGRNADNAKYVSIREYYAYKLQIRSNDKSYLLRFGRLLQQYIVDVYVKLETQRLAFYRTQQQEIRQEFLQGVVDAMACGETKGSAIGRRIILPADFIGGPRNMRRKYVDAMTLVQKFGKPDIFLTLTCNPNWPEFKEHLFRHEEVQNRADLVVRIFHAKLQLFKDEILKKNVFGDVVAYTYVIEFQKRGLPHAHFLLILKCTSKMYHPEEYDEVVCAEIPDETSNPHLFRMVLKHMLHGPCGSLNPNNVCMKNGKSCKNSYPKPFSSQTTQTADAYPAYRRRDNGVTVRFRDATLDNRWVVPYNPYLLCKFDCHINIEICSTIKAVKYIYKYICKGSDKISFSLSSNNNPVTVDEIHDFQAGRWISPPEGAWRIFRFPLGDIKPSVIHLPLHLENYQPMTFKKRDCLRNVINNPVQRKTMLTEFFFQNRTDRYAQSLNLTYSEFPDHFVWKADKRSWSPRQTGDSIGRIVIAHPSEGERYYLRILLSKIRCPKSYADLKVFNGTQVNSFREAALLRGYLLDDNSQHLCLEEASAYHMPYELRRLIATLLVYTAPNNPRQLWETFEDKLLEDFVSSNNLTRRQARKAAFQQLNVFLQSMGKNLQEFDILPQDFTCMDFEDETREIRAEHNIVVSEQDMLSIGKLNKRQKIAFDVIIERVNDNKGGAFFIDGPGGTGKTFLYRALLAKIRSNGNVALATATSGIAASLLPGGRTAHSRFKIPIDLAEGALCRVSKQSSLATLIKNSKLIIWDEAPMAKRSSIECLDDLLRDLLDSTEIFGGKVVVLGGDFRQTLPVVRKGNKSETIAASLINSPLWPLLHQLQLQENMRALLDPYFTDFLLRLGSGNESLHDATLVALPESMIINDSSTSDSLNVLIQSVYSEMFSESTSCPLSLNRAILTTKNSFVDEINDMLIGRFGGEETEYNSFDETIDPNDQAQYEDLLHSLTPNGMPPHRLVLKVNSPIILLRNINPTEGLCNGTRLFCKRFSRNVICAEISFGDFAGKEVFIHRIPLLLPTGEHYVVPFKRVQFPIKLCFAMTINKAQGQTLDFVGIYLKEPVFSHGQLYVALSRARKSEDAKVLIKHASSSNNKETINIVYREIFDHARGCNM